MKTNITKINYCEECGKPLFRGITCKTCNPVSAQSEKQKINYTCSVRENGRPCNSTGQLFRINPKNETPQFWCNVHYEKLRPKNEFDKEMERRTETFRQAIKDSALKPSEYFHQHFGFDLKDSASEITKQRTERVKDILLEQNNPYAIMSKENV